MVRSLRLIGALAGCLPLAASAAIDSLETRQTAAPAAQLASCPGYTASNVKQRGSSLVADLKLAGAACNAYGKDIKSLKLTVTYETDQRLHVLIEDAAQQAYRVPSSVFPRPDSEGANPKDADLEFAYKTSPFTFQIKRRKTGEVLFDTSAAPLVFEDQYLRLRTALPKNPNLYGLGEHSDHLRLNTTGYVRTLWSRDAYGIPEGNNLYGNHPIYFDHRGKSGSHGVFLLSSAGMDIKIDNTAQDGQYLEYNVLGGVIDLYFLAGSNPTEVSEQYAELAGLPAMHGYWALGFHNCRYGYRDFYAVAEVIYNYSAAGIPLETQWTDIDYMFKRRVFTVDPDRFSLARMRDIVAYLHKHNQNYIVMVDPAVAYEDYPTFNRGKSDGIFMKFDNGTIFEGVVWPGPTAYPDWFHPATQDYWDKEFRLFFNPQSGVDIDGLWIDMNEAANFCPFPCPDPKKFSADNHFPPSRPVLRSQPRPIPGFPPEFQPGAAPYPPDGTVYNAPYLPQAPDTVTKKSKRDSSPFGGSLDTPKGIPGRDLLAPPYRIKNSATWVDYGGLSNNTIRTDLHHANGLAELDVHNLYGTMMSSTSRGAMLSRRPSERPLIITRSTFAGAGKNVGKWLGDNLSFWNHYRQQIQGMLNMNAIFQVPMVGSDVCGFGGNTTETLCARWAQLGAFNPFYRNHNGDTSLPQEFYMWPTVAEAARKAIDIRYRLLDYFYTALYEQTQSGTPSLNPVFFKYPEDSNTFGIELQFFYGHSLLVSPVTEENATDVTIYLPNDLFYDWYTYGKVQGHGATMHLTGIDFTTIPLHIKSGSVIPLRSKGAMTTKELRSRPFNILIAPDKNGEASGSLYLDDGVSLRQTKGTSHIVFSYEDGKLEASGKFGYQAEGNKVSSFTVLGVKSLPKKIKIRKTDGKGKGEVKASAKFDAKAGALTVEAELLLDGEFTAEWA